MADWLTSAIADLTGVGRSYSSWLEALHDAAPHAADGVTTERDAQERWAEIADSVLRHPATTDETRDVARRLLDAVGAPSNTTDAEGDDDGD